MAHGITRRPDRGTRLEGSKSIVLEDAEGPEEIMRGVSIDDFSHPCHQHCPEGPEEGDDGIEPYEKGEPSPGAQHLDRNTGDRMGRILTPSAEGTDFTLLPRGMHTRGTFAIECCPKCNRKGERAEYGCGAIVFTHRVQRQNGTTTFTDFCQITPTTSSEEKKHEPAVPTTE